MKTKILVGLMLVLICLGLNAQTGNPPGVDEPVFQQFILASNGVSQTATTNLIASSNLWLKAGAENVTFWVSSSGNLGSVAGSGNQIFISPISIGRFGTNNTATNICTWSETPYVVNQTPLGITNCIKATNFLTPGIEGFAVTAIKNTSGGGLTNTVWITYRTRPK